MQQSAGMETHEEKPLSWLQQWDQRATDSRLGQYFEIRKRNSTMIQELRAGLVCFLSVCYIIPVNSGILSDTGGSCEPATECLPANFAAAGSDCKYFDPSFQLCIAAFKNDLIASTCIASMLGTLIMSVFARMPLAVAPAMGVNAYFTYNVVGVLSTKRVTYKQALAAVFVEGFIFLFITVTGVRGKIMELIPKSIMYSTVAGIGCFLAFIGLQHSKGIGLVTFDPATLVTLGGCPADERVRMYSLGPLDLDGVCTGPNPPNLGPASPSYQCLGGQMTSPTTWLGICTGIIMVALMMKDVRGSILYGILFCTFISWIPNHEATYFHARSSIAGGEDRYHYWRKGATLPSVTKTGGQLDFGALHTSDVWIALITFLYLDFLDATSTMFAMARLVSEQVPGFINAKGQWPRQMQTMLTDGIAIVIGSLLGTSPLTVFAESAVGIREGGRTGVSSFVVACGFGISMFLSPIFASIPPYATGPAIILVGSLMMEHSRYVAWEDMRQAAPAFLTILLMPLTYSVAYGVICGLSFVIILWLVDCIWETILVVSGAYHGEKTLHHVWLDTMSHYYVAFGHEETLVNELPGYLPDCAMDSSRSGSGAGGNHSDSKPKALAESSSESSQKDISPVV